MKENRQNLQSEQNLNERSGQEGLQQQQTNTPQQGQREDVSLNDDDLLQEDDRDSQQQGRSGNTDRSDRRL